MNFCSSRVATAFLVLLTATTFSLAQTPPAAGESRDAIRTRAFELAGQNRYLDALPLLEKIAALYPKDAELWAHYGIAIGGHSMTIVAPAERKAWRIKAYDALAKARELGTKNQNALSILDHLTPDGEDDDLAAADPEFENNIRQGEAFFGRGEYDKAFAAYEKAHKIDPKSYEAVLFMGDSLYAGAKFKESETWFARATELDPDREHAYRFWGDALMEQKKTIEARDKFVDALIAEPFSRLTWDRLVRWAGETKTKAVPQQVTPPGNAVNGEIVLDEKLLRTEDGSILWKKYNEARLAQMAEGKRRKLSDEVTALRKVAEAARAEQKAGKLKSPHQSLINLVKLDDAGLTEAYILLLRSNDELFEEYPAYKNANRTKLRKFVIEFLLGV